MDKIGSYNEEKRSTAAETRGSVQKGLKIVVLTEQINYSTLTCFRHDI